MSGKNSGMVKSCSKCKELLPADCFNSDKSKKSGLSSRCKKCTPSTRQERALQRRSSYLVKLKRETLRANGQKECSRCKQIKSFDKYYYLSTTIDKLRSACIDCEKEKWNERSEYNKAYSKKRYQNRDVESEREYRRRRYHEIYKPSATYRLNASIRSCIVKAIRTHNQVKNKRTIDILGCNWHLFKKHIERQFLPGMTWSNYGDWHLDHIIPISSASNKSEVITLNHYTNFQPLWASDNIRKSNKIIEPIQTKLAI